MVTQLVRILTLYTAKFMAYNSTKHC